MYSGAPRGGKDPCESESSECAENRLSIDFTEQGLDYGHRQIGG